MSEAARRHAKEANMELGIAGRHLHDAEQAAEKSGDKGIAAKIRKIKQADFETLDEILRKLEK